MKLVQIMITFAIGMACGIILCGIIYSLTIGG